jgi:prolyl-tRNA editing enzyme YbaK/EbsC (Cys-tRNA(Pro) deacylase)
VGGSEERFQAAARALGVPVALRRFPEGTKTAEAAARAVGCDVGQIVKSLVFMADGSPLLALTSGGNRADTAALGRLVGAEEVRRATPEEARQATAFAIGGTPPFGHPAPIPVLVDRELLGYDELWAAAGTPDTVFPISPGLLLAASGGEPADFGIPMGGPDAIPGYNR